jgi:hypothetical protein
LNFSGKEFKFWVQDTWFRILGSGFIVSDSGFRSYGLGFRALSSRLRVKVPRFRAQNLGSNPWSLWFRLMFRVQGVGFVF